MRICKPLLFTILLLAVFAQSSLATQSIGIIKSVDGEVFLSNSTTNLRAVPNMKLNMGDNIRTGPNSNVGLIFEDDTVVSLGSNSAMTIDEFIFNPAEKELSFISRLIHGTFSFISGQIAKLAPEKVKIETPDATLGVRGTKFVVKID